MASKRQAKKKGKAPNNAQSAQAQTSAAASQGQAARENALPTEGIQPAREAPELSSAHVGADAFPAPSRDTQEEASLHGEALNASGDRLNPGSSAAAARNEHDTQGETAAQDEVDAAPQTNGKDAPPQTNMQQNAPVASGIADAPEDEQKPNLPAEEVPGEKAEEAAVPEFSAAQTSPEEKQAGQAGAEDGDLALPDAPEGLPAFPPAQETAPHVPQSAPQKAAQPREARKQKKRHYALFYIFILTLAVVACSAVSIYWMFSTSENGLFDVKEDVELPNLIGTRWTDAKDNETYSGFLLEKEEVFDDEVPAGEIVDQNPRAPRQVKEGSRIVAKVSKGVEMVTVPELAGWNKDTAREKLRALNLTLLIKPEETTDVPVDCVVRTDPAAGSIVKAGATVTLYIRRDSTEVSYVTVPTCIGSTSEQQASIRLTQRGLLMRIITVEDASPAGTVIGQSPSAGAMVVRGTTVTVTISSGPPPVVVPPAPPESESESESDSETSSSSVPSSSSSSAASSAPVTSSTPVVPEPTPDPDPVPPPVTDPTLP